MSAPLSVAACASAAFAFGLSLRDAPVHASPAYAIDDDQDGLVNAQELVLGTNLQSPDTDNDGYGDLEEIARKSDPKDRMSTPSGNDVEAGMAAFAETGEIESITAVYFPPDQMSGWLFYVGVRVGETLVPLPPSMYLTGAVLKTYGGATASGTVVTLGWSFQQSLLSSLGDASIFCTLANVSTGKIEAAAALNLFDIAGTPTEIQPNQYAQTGGPGISAGGAGSKYRPLTGSVPASWSPDQICEQSTEPVGSSGAVTILEIVSAECISADAYCPGTCSGMAGGLVRVVDPFSLVGG